MDEDCSLETELSDSIVLQSVRWLQIFVALAAILLVIFIVCRHLTQTILDSVTIMCLKVIFMNSAVYSIGIGVTQSSFVVARIMAVTPCDAEIPKVICLFRIMASSVTPVFVVIYASITIQQALSTWKYPLRVRLIVARICIVVAYGYVIIYGFFGYRNEQFTGKTPFCSSYTPHSDVLILTNLNVMMVLGVINLFFAIFLLKYNKKVVSDESKSFELSRKFQRVRNLYAAEQFIIIVAMHSATHFVHFCLYSFTFYYRPYYTQTQFTILHAVVNIIPYYCLFGPLTFLVLIILGRFRRNDHVRSMIATMHSSNAQEVYFKGLRDAWNQ